MKSKIVEIDDLGTAELTRRRRTKNIIIRVKGTRLIKVSLPFWTSYREALAFVEKSKDWIKKRFRENFATSTQLSLFEPVGKDYLKALRKQAKEYFPQKLDELASKYGFKYKRLYLKNAISQWGSCSSQNNINLSIHLMKLPDDLIEYVMIHELVHTKQKNHKSGFYEMLGSIYKNYRSFEKRLKTYERPG